MLEHTAPESTCKSERYMTAEDDGESRSQGELVAPMTAAGGEDDHPTNHHVHPPTAEDWVEIKESEEAEPLTPAPSPVMPSAAEVEEHNLTHTPYRSWCDCCVQGRGLGEQRGRHAGRVHRIPRVGIDYFFNTVRGLKKREELDIPNDAKGNEKLEAKRRSGEIVKCVVVRCYETKCIFGHVIPCKGPDEDNFTVNLIVGDIAWMGHVRLILKTDQEKSLVALVSRALQAMRVQVTDLETITVEHSQAYDSQASGGTELGVRALRGLYRTLRLCLEKRIGFVLPVQHPLSSWLLEHTALLLNASLRGEDGLTPWARVRGRAFGQRLIGFGESVLYKLPLQGPQHDLEGNMAARALPGVFLGYLTPTV